ncbi:sulfur carrier protein ThiS [Ameyamaea chiangmaiensis]|uniref:Sulfur carrier protein ThiS n=1 Tax=Ameyamaea chiangmaiensis TaxID=442969 RepID=A0A850PFX1_9PROT|nr:sulfur carrier protein ThiS [Ameyamaea chiangmaiensis]MBS4073618.1 sulfur carrier protein ThiS [Ameyamaea chiangmaiensis]NVN40041.1 sulfur carrier protein ThiS [Ameyamaea chiangmaiensis]
MRITVNDEPRDVTGDTLSVVLDELGYGAARVATALDGLFVPVSRRATASVTDGARLEILAPMQGG